MKNFRNRLQVPKFFYTFVAGINRNKNEDNRTDYPAN